MPVLDGLKLTTSGAFKYLRDLIKIGHAPIWRASSSLTKYYPPGAVNSMGNFWTTVESAPFLDWDYASGIGTFLVDGTYMFGMTMTLRQYVTGGYPNWGPLMVYLGVQTSVSGGPYTYINGCPVYELIGDPGTKAAQNHHGSISFIQPSGYSSAAPYREGDRFKGVIGVSSSSVPVARTHTVLGITYQNFFVARIGDVLRK